MSAKEKRDIMDIVDIMHSEKYDHLYEMDEDELYHYGMPRRSGRYPYGSGDNPYQHASDFLARVEEDRKKGKTDTEIANDIGLKTHEFRAQIGIAEAERRGILVSKAEALKAKGYGPTEIARKMSTPDKTISESTVRSLLDEDAKAKMLQARKTADFIKSQIDEKGMVDVGTMVEKKLRVSPQKMAQALYILEQEGYPVYGGRVPNATNPGKTITMKVACPPGTEHSEIFNYGNIHQLYEYTSSDGGESFHKAIQTPKSLDGKRVKIRYAEEGGIDKDGLIEIRRGVDDISIGDSAYAQVRILVNGTHYIKGMAVYSDNLPEGTDIMFNTNKKKGTPMCGDDKTVLKKIKTDDPDNPFGALISYQHVYKDENGKEQLGVVNRTREEGDWLKWSDKLPSQFLGKQNKSLIESQLGLTISDRQAEFNEIKALENPAVKKMLLETFANDCDSASVHLKAAALPRQKYQVLLPLTNIKDNEVYAPNYNNGEKVALIRYPHGGTFEIPILTVNNRNKEGISVMGKNAKDAIGINSKVAERLSGADFDGDTAMVIPTNSRVKITSTNSLKELEGFDPKMAYPEVEGMKIMKNTQNEMGRISNLITDMTIKGATEDELARAVKHSMCVIDAEKHRLDYKRSERENNISALRKEYQEEYDPVTGKVHGGASTILSRAKSEQSVDKRIGSPKINQKGKPWYDPSKPEGALIHKTARKNNPGEEWYDPSKPEGSTVYVHIKEYSKTTGKPLTQQSTKMAETDDAMTLVSKHRNPREIMYANYANKMKSMANEARKEMVYSGKIELNKEASKKYESEVKSLSDKLLISELNKPKERQAQFLANSRVDEKIKNLELDRKKDNDLIKKLNQQELVKARIEVGAQRHTIDITDREWEAIQAGAISDSKLKRILYHSDLDKIRERATPKANKEMTQAKISRINQMSARGYTNAEIAKKLGISTSTVSKYL